MRRIRLEIRLLMVLVALVAVALGLVQRRVAFLRTARFHEQNELRNRIAAELYPRHISDFEGEFESVPGGGGHVLRWVDTPENRKRSEERKAKRKRFGALAEYHGLLKLKYRKAAAAPWMLQGPDPVSP